MYELREVATPEQARAWRREAKNSEHPELFSVNKANYPTFLRASNVAAETAIRSILRRNPPTQADGVRITSSELEFAYQLYCKDEEETIFTLDAKAQHVCSALNHAFNEKAKEETEKRDKR